LREAQSGRDNQNAQPKITVRLPEDDVGGALHRLSVLIAQEKILDRDIVAIDLRVPDRLAIEPAASAQPVGDSKDTHINK
jgi:cell division protein FtsQ